MKKLYKKGTVHPTPPLISDHLSFLPAAIFTLTLSLSPDDKEVLAYLLSSSSNNYTNIDNIKNKKNKNIQERNSGDHPSSFKCCCFRCYLSFWVRWDASPNRQLIHEIIDAFEDGLTHIGKQEKRKKERKKERKRRGGRNNGEKGVVEFGEVSPVKEDEEGVSGGGDGQVEEEAEEVEVEMEEGSIRRFVSFVGEKIWGVWN